MPNTLFGALFTEVKFSFLKSALKDACFETQLGLFEEKILHLIEAIFLILKVVSGEKEGGSGVFIFHWYWYALHWRFK